VLAGQTIVCTDAYEGHEDPVVDDPVNHAGIIITGENPPLNTATLYGTIDILVDGVTLQYLRIVPGGLYGADEAAVYVAANGVTVQENIIEDMTGKVECDSFTIKGVHVYSGDNTFTDILIQNNTIRNIINTNCTGDDDDDDDDDDDCTMVEDFEQGTGWPWAPWVQPFGLPEGGEADEPAETPPFKSGIVGASYAHDGSYGITDPDWTYRTDVNVGNAGDRLTMWTYWTGAWARTYMGVGASSGGCYSFVAGFNTNNLIIQQNPGFSYVSLAETPYVFTAYKWYKMEIVFNSPTSITGNLYDSDGTTLITSVSYSGITGTPGGIAMRSFGGVYMDTIEYCPAPASFSTKDTIYSEDFESGIPGTYTLLDNDGNGYTWTTTNPGGRTPPAGSNCVGLFPICDTDEWHYEPEDDWMITEDIDCSGYENVKLSFGSYFHSYSWYDQAGYVYVDGNLVYSITGGDDYEQTDIDISAYADGNANVNIEFNFYTTDWAYYWMVDNILLTGDPVGDDDDDDDDCECTVGGAVGIMVQGFLDGVDILRNDITEIHSAGWSYGIEVTPTATMAPPPKAGGFKYSSDFESDDGGWVATADWDPVGDFEWTNTYDSSNYVPGSYPTSEVPPPTAYSGTGLWGTVLYAPHTNPPTSGMMTYLSQTFDFTGVTGAEISWMSWENVFGDWDHCNLYVNGDHVWGPSWQGSSPSWAYRYVDLSAYDGMSNVEVKFALSATTVVAYAGWYIDDVEVSGTGGGDDDDDDDDGIPIPQDVYVEGNYLCTIGDGSVYDVWNDSMAPPFPGVMFSLDETSPQASDGDARQVTLFHNFFDNKCQIPVLAVINKDLAHVLNATYNYWGNIEGPSSYPEGDTNIVRDPYNNEPADAYDYSTAIVNYGDVHFYKYIGLDVKASPKTFSTETGVPVLFDATGSWAADFGAEAVLPTCEWSISLKDTYGDGWNGNYLNVIVNGDTVLSGATLPGGTGPVTYAFPVLDGATIVVDYFQVGGWPYENSYEVFDWEGNSVVLKAGVYPNGPGDWTGIGYCPGVDVEPDLSYEPIYYWTFEPTYHSNEKVIGYPFSAPGNYDVSLRIQANSLGSIFAGVAGLPSSFHNAWSNFMFDFAHCDIEVVAPGAPLSANADGGNLGGYETVVDHPITLRGIASGGTAPYIYEWDFGNGETEVSEGQEITTVYKEVGTYTVTLTVYDYKGAIATDTSQVTVHNEEVMVINAGGPYNAVIDQPIFFKATAYGGKAPYGYLWDFGDGGIGATANPFHIYNEPGTYTVTLTVTDSENEEQTTTTQVSVDNAESNELVIKSVKGGLLVSAVIKAGDQPVDWSINVDGSVFFGGEASGTIPANLQASVKLPLTIGFGKVDITVRANDITDTYSAFMIGPFVLNLQ
jgi:PKD repeat protein